MRADHAIDLVGAVSRFFQIAQERQLQIAPHRVRSDLVVADAGIDDDALALRLDDERVDAHSELALFVRKNRIEQSASFLTFSGVASGMMKVPGHGDSLSTIRVILTSPTLNWFIADPPVSMPT